MKKYLIAAILVGVGIVIAFPLFSMSLEGDGIKSLELDLGEMVLLDRIYYASAHIRFE